MVLRYWQIVLFSAALCVATACGNSRESKKVEKRNIPISLHDGDIAFRRGMGAASHAVVSVNRRGSFSHVGVVANLEGQWYVIHEVPYEGKSRDDDKIYCEPLGEFYNTIKAASGALYRLPGLDSVGRQAIRNYLLQQVAQETPFDHDYDLEDSGRQYCSELVWRSYLEVGVDISNGSRTRVTMPGFAGIHIMPADIENNSNLELLYSF